MVFSNPLPLTEYPGSESTFVNLLKSDLSFQLEECLLLLLTSLLKTSVLLMDERFPAVHLELLEMCRETVELVLLFTLKSPATALKMDERFPALHLELLEMCRETVELVILLP